LFGPILQPNDVGFFQHYGVGFHFRRVKYQEKSYHNIETLYVIVNNKIERDIDCRAQTFDEMLSRIIENPVCKEKFLQDIVDRIHGTRERLKFPRSSAFVFTSYQFFEDICDELDRRITRDEIARLMGVGKTEIDRELREPGTTGWIEVDQGSYKFIKERKRDSQGIPISEKNWRGIKLKTYTASFPKDGTIPPGPDYRKHNVIGIKRIDSSLKKTIGANGDPSTLFLKMIRNVDARKDSGPPLVNDVRLVNSIFDESNFDNIKEAIDHLSKCLMRFADNLEMMLSEYWDSVAMDSKERLGEMAELARFKASVWIHNLSKLKEFQKNPVYRHEVYTDDRDGFVAIIVALFLGLVFNSPTSLELLGKTNLPLN
jgi:hypothetical protein